MSTFEYVHIGFSIFFLSHSGLATRSILVNIPNTAEECQFVRVPAITNVDCNGYYDNTPNDPIIDDSMICSDSSDEKGSCTGDEGGPYICNINKKAVLVGVISWSNGCADPNFPGVYARVTHVLDWITENMVIF